MMPNHAVLILLLFVFIAGGVLGFVIGYARGGNYVEKLYEQ